MRSACHWAQAHHERSRPDCADWRLSCSDPRPKLGSFTLRLTDSIDVELAVSASALLILAGVHVLFPAFERKFYSTRALWSHFAAGIALGYATLYLMPKLTDYTLVLKAENALGWEPAQYGLYMAFLLGLLAYLAVGNMRGVESRRGVAALHLQLAAFAFYNVLTGYFITSLPRQGVLAQGLGTLVFAVHLLGIDHQLRAADQDFFDRRTRWITAAAVLGGGALAMLQLLSGPVVVVGSAFLGGAIMMNVMKEEVPAADGGHLKPFLAGVATFAVIAVIIRSIPRA